MTSSDILIADNLSSTRERLRASNRSLWFGAISFEDRCIASLAALERDSLRTTDGLVLEYATQVRPFREDENRRSRNRERVTALGGRVCAHSIETRGLDPYAFQDLQDVLTTAISIHKYDFIIFDITCLTKIHTLALAAALARERTGFGWVAAYSLPENYGNFIDAHQPFGWRDIIVAPLADTAMLFNEAGSRGVIIPGHEADRLIVGLGELEPSGGLILVGDVAKRPDLRYVCERKNHKVIRQLTHRSSEHWTKTVVRMTDLETVRKELGREIDTAKSYEAAIILFPYGPKWLLFFTAIQLCREYPDASWLVYPIPTAYDVNYSEGIEATGWLTPTPASSGWL